MINIEFKSIRELLNAFPDEQTCINHLEELRWNGIVVSPFDETSKVYKCAGNKYRCKNTGKYFNVRTQTLFDNTKIELQTWFLAIYLLTGHKKGISSVQLAVDLNVTQKTAWFMAHRIRACFGLDEMRPDKLDNFVEVDETFVGGKDTNKHKKVKEAKRLAGTNDKAIVIGAIERNGGIRAEIINKVTSEQVKPFIENNIRKSAIMMTDEHSAYLSLKSDYFHEKVSHAIGEYVRGLVHTNSIEGFWSLLKRGIIGIYHFTSKKHLQKYVDEFSFRYNSRHFSTLSRFNLLLSNSHNRLTYKNLIA